MDWVRRQRGVALAIVVWFIAGMSLLVAGIVSHARVDTRMTQLHVAKAQAVAAGDGAIQLMLAERLLRVEPAPAGDATLAGHYQLGRSRVSVTLYPAAGLVNLNTAPQQVLAALFLVVGRLPEDKANMLADNVVRWRAGFRGPDIAAAHGFQAIEDLLRVEGMSRTLLDGIRDFIVAGTPGGTGTDWVLAPATLLQVLEKANPGALDDVNSRRQQAAGSVDRASRSMSGMYRADALVNYGEQTWLRRRWVSVGSTPAGSGLPWRTVRTEPPRVYKQ
ncbi:MAG TPA: hypothetical protein VIV27_02760 [Halioglobus sp.]